MARVGPEKVFRPCEDRVRLFPKCELKKVNLLLYESAFSVKMSNVREHSDSEFYYPKKKGKARWSHDKTPID